VSVKKLPKQRCPVCRRSVAVRDSVLQQHNGSDGAYCTGSYGSTMTREQRMELKRRLAALDAEIAPLEKARDEACKPFDAQLRPLLDRREELLESAPNELAGNCEGCGVPLFFGDRAQNHSEAGILFCEDCSPSWQDCLQEIESGNVTADHFEEPGDYENYVALVRSMPIRLSPIAAEM
jgi:hypothetical protein